MRMLNRLSVVLLASASVIATPAAATDYLFDADGDAYTIYFDGFSGDPSNTIPGLTSNLYLQLDSGFGTDVLTFSYVLTNTSTVGGDDSRVSGFAFNSTPNATGGDADDAGEFDNVILGGGYPNNIGDVEVCLTNSNACQGGGGGAAGAYLGDPATGTFTLEYGAPVASLYLGDFWVRYQGLTGLGQVGSASGGDTPPVPEPSTWALMLFGFGALGFAMRRRRGKETLRVRYA